MEPTQPAANRDDGFKPKWRHFSPMARVWLQNPFGDDIDFQVADEYNRAYTYRLPAGKVSELPGGAIATLGVKKVVDRLILDNKDDAPRMWDEAVRTKHENDVILRIKETSPLAGAEAGGVIDLGTKGSDVQEKAATVAAPPEEAFPSLKQPASTQLDELPSEVKNGLDNVISASLPSNNDVVSANNAHANIKG